MHVSRSYLYSILLHRYRPNFHSDYPMRSFSFPSYRCCCISFKNFIFLVSSSSYQSRDTRKNNQMNGRSIIQDDKNPHFGNRIRLFSKIFRKETKLYLYYASGTLEMQYNRGKRTSWSLKSFRFSFNCNMLRNSSNFVPASRLGLSFQPYLPQNRSYRWPSSSLQQSFLEG